MEKKCCCVTYDIRNFSWKSFHQPELPHEWNEEVGRAGLPEEGVVQELGGGGALRGISHQHLKHYFIFDFNLSSVGSMWIFAII